MKIEPLYGDGTTNPEDWMVVENDRGVFYGTFPQCLAYFKANIRYAAPAKHTFRSRLKQLYYKVKGYTKRRGSV